MRGKKSRQGFTIIRKVERAADLKPRTGREVGG